MRHIRVLALIMVALMGSMAFSQESGKGSEKSGSREDLAKQLFEIDQKWLEAARTKNVAYLKELWTDEFLEVMPGFEPVSKSELLELVAKADRGPGGGAVPSDFKLWAVYGDVAIATDHTSWKGGFVPGKNTAGEYRVVRFFVKQNGKWRVGGAALVPMTSP